DHALLWLMHHAISDNWSLAVLMREVLVLYAALRRGEAPALEPLAIEYADYAAWQRSPAVLAGRSHQLAYWVERLRGLQRLNLPTDFARPAHPSFRGASVSADLPLPLREALRGFCGRHRATPFFVLLAVFKLMLSRQSGSTDIAIGTPVANRHHLATEQLVGTLVNTLVMRTDLSGDPDFTQLVQRVRNTALEAFEHQDAPFDELVEALGQDRVAQPEGIVRVLFNVLNAPLGRHAPVEFDYETFDLDRTAAQFDLSVHVDTGFSHRIHLEYATDLYAPATARRLLENYLALVTQVLAQPALPLSGFGMLAPAQLALLRDEWNGTARALPPDLLVHRHLRTADASLRDRVAVVDATGRDMRYGELESRANALARA
ncbi:MAG: non-ribosomal peptide synthetase, partial [Comamonadaceae bacterium]